MNQKPYTIAVIGDIHYGACALPARKGAYGASLLLRAVQRLNRFIAPDVVLLAGDCLEAPEAPEALTRLAEGVIAGGIHIFTHPFRILKKRCPDLRPWHEPLAASLRRHGVAVEMNFHHAPAEGEFIALCLGMGIKVALGSDAHNLYEVGELAPHLTMLRALGCGPGELERVLFRWHG